MWFCFEALIVFLPWGNYYLSFLGNYQETAAAEKKLISVWMD